MADNIFIIDRENSLTKLERTDYDSESPLQRLLADHLAVPGITSHFEQNSPPTRAAVYSDRSIMI